MTNDDEKAFCYFPFTQILLQTNGTIYPCCWNQDFSYGTVPQQTISEVWNSEAAQQLRKEFLDGNPVICAQQIRHIACHKWSYRNEVKERELTSIQSQGPSRLDI